jgi:hypothetical protein
MLSRLRAGLRQCWRDDRGISLMELVVAMGISTILGTMGILFFVGADRTGYTTVLTNQNTGDARNTLDSWTSMLRVAGWLDPVAMTDRFEEITPTKIVFYANLGNRATANQQTGALTKVALMLRTTNATTGAGRLIQVTFNPDNTTVKSVRQLAFNAMPVGGPGHAVFQPYNRIGSPVDTVNTTGCLSNSTPKPGLCLQKPPAGAGMLDPTVGTTGLSVSAGSLRGNPAMNVDGFIDKALASIAGITVTFTAVDPSSRAAMDFAGSASVNSGFPS